MRDNVITGNRRGTWLDSILAGIVSGNDGNQGAVVYVNTGTLN